MKLSDFTLSKATIPVLALGIAGILAVLYFWQLPPFTSTVQSTNNAFVKGRVTLIAPQQAGYITNVAVTDYQQVKQGDLLFQLDDRIYRQQLLQAQGSLAQQQNALDNFEANRGSKQASLDVATAQLDSANAALHRAEADAGRSSSLLTSGLAAKSSDDQVQSALSQAEAGVAQAQANVAVAKENLALVEGGIPGLQGAVQSAQAAVDLAQINITNAKVVAPVDGTLGEVTGRIGQYVSAGSQLTSVTPGYKWVVANFKETQMYGMMVGQAVKFTVDGLNNVSLTGRIAQISPATGSEFSVIKPDNATGNFTKIAQRIPVRIELDADQPAAEQLLAGMSVEVSVDVAQGDGNLKVAQRQ